MLVQQFGFDNAASCVTASNKFTTSSVQEVLLCLEALYIRFHEVIDAYLVFLLSDGFDSAASCVMTSNKVTANSVQEVPLCFGNNVHYTSWNSRCMPCAAHVPLHYLG